MLQFLLQFLQVCTMVSSTAPAAFPFPHVTLTPIVGRPTEPTIKVLLREVYTNARAVPSTRGGGVNGYLGSIMPTVDYARHAGPLADPWTTVTHPGSLLVHPDGTEAHKITADDRAYDSRLREFKESMKVQTELKQQLLAAIEPTYVQELASEDFGYADVTPRALLAHLQQWYSEVEPEELERNRATLQSTWNVDEPIENLWEKVISARQFAARHGDPISELTALHLLLTSLESTGVFTDACDKWRDLPSFGKNIASFRVHFDQENKTRLRKLTAQQGGFHGANVATTRANAATAAAAAAAASTTTGTPVVIVGETRMYYCHSHGLGWNPNHTSPKCSNKKEGHKDDATINKMQGGCNTIMTNRRARVEG